MWCYKREVTDAQFKWQLKLMFTTSTDVRNKMHTTNYNHLGHSNIWLDFMTLTSNIWECRSCHANEDPSWQRNSRQNSPFCFLRIQTQIKLLGWCLRIFLLSLVRLVTLTCALNFRLTLILSQADSLVVIGPFTVAVALRDIFSIYIGWVLFSWFLPDYCIVGRALDWVPGQMLHGPLWGLVTRCTGSCWICDRNPTNDSTLSSLFGLPLEGFHLGKNRHKLLLIQPINAGDKPSKHVIPYCKPSSTFGGSKPDHKLSRMVTACVWSWKICSSKYFPSRSS